MVADELTFRAAMRMGDAHVLYRSMRGKLFSLPTETLVYPAHDYQGRCVSSIAQENSATRDSVESARWRISWS